MTRPRSRVLGVASMDRRVVRASVRRQCNRPRAASNGNGGRDHGQDWGHGMRPWQSRRGGDHGIPDGGRRHRRTPAAVSRRFGIPRVRPADHPRRPRQTAPLRRPAYPGGARDAVCRGPRQERHPLGAEDLCRPARRSADRLRPRPLGRYKAAGGCQPAHRSGGSPLNQAGFQSPHPAPGGRPRHLGLRCQFEHQQGRPHALGGHGLWLERGLL